MQSLYCVFCEDKFSCFSLEKRTSTPFQSLCDRFKCLQLHTIFSILFVESSVFQSSIFQRYIAALFNALPLSPTNTVSSVARLVVLLKSKHLCIQSSLPSPVFPELYIIVGLPYSVFCAKHNIVFSNVNTIIQLYVTS